MRGEGSIYRRGKTWWISYWVRGQRFRESGGKTEATARAKLKVRMREIHGDRFIGPMEERVTVKELLEALLVHLKTKGAKSVRAYDYHMDPVRGFFSLTRAIDLNTAQVERYIQERQRDGRKNATINRETGALKQALNLARKQGRLLRVPYIPMLKEDNARQGFFEREDFEAVVENLPAAIADIARFAYLSGWRKGEILPLRWDAVDRQGKEVRLRTSKSGRPRSLPLEGELDALVERRWSARSFTTWDGQSHVSDFVFHRYGRPWKDIAKPWNEACDKAGMKGRLFHDLRRTAVRNMIRAGVPQSVAMSISGHETVSMFLRYNITSEDDKREALRRTQRHLAAAASGKKVYPFPREAAKPREQAQNSHSGGGEPAEKPRTTGDPGGSVWESNPPRHALAYRQRI
jgi:integrase